MMNSKVREQTKEHLEFVLEQIREVLAISKVEMYALVNDNLWL